MSLMKKTTGAALALAAAGLIGCSGGTTSSDAAAEKMVSVSVSSNVHCYGVNKCKGHNDCKSAENACKGHSACKGHGFISMPTAACDHVGGKVGA